MFTAGKARVRIRARKRAAEGARHRKVAELAIREINAEGGPRFKLVVSDSRSTAEGAMDAARQLVDKEKIVALLGPVKSFEIVGMMPTVTELKVPTVIGGTNPRLTEGGSQWLFRCRPSDDISARAMVQFIKGQGGHSKIGILHEKDVFGSGGANLIEKYARDLGLTVVKREGFGKGTKDFAPYLDAINAAGAEAIVVYSTTGVTAAIEKEFHKRGKQSLYIGSPSSVNHSVIRDAGEAAEGLYGVVDAFPSATPAGQKAIQAYKKEYGAEPDTIDLYLYDGAHLLAKAIRDGGTDPQKIRAGLLKSQGYEGVMGTYHFTPQGDGLSDVAVVRVKGGRLAPVGTGR